MRSSVAVAAILLAGSLLAGIGFCALLPPFEGFDETAHYSYMAQIAETGTWPRLNGPMSADIDDYLNAAPTPVGGRWSYWTFFRAPAATQQAGANAIHGPRDVARAWRAGAISNWEGQHPPLYYALFAPLWRLSKGWSIYAQIVLLRGVSYLFAWGGLAIVTIAIARGAATEPNSGLLILGPPLWPALFPMWFPEMARLGNDSLILLQLALAFVAMQRAFGPRAQTRDFALLGTLCGLALLTKATALPFACALGFVLARRIWRSAGTDAVRPAAVHAAAFGLMVLAVAGWWYAKNLVDYGSLFVSADNVALAQQGGLLDGLRKNLSLPTSLVGLASIVRSFAWTGTWSFVFLPRAVEFPLSVLVVIVAIGWIWQTYKENRLSETESVSVLTLALFGVALVYHMLVFIALYATSTPGDWYLHSLAPLLALFVAIGLDRAATFDWARRLIGALVVYPVLFLVFALAFHLSYFDGCLRESVGDHRYGLSSIASCAVMPHEIMSHLAVLGDPAVAIPLFGIGCVIMMAGVLLFAWPRFFAAAR